MSKQSNNLYNLTLRLNTALWQKMPIQQKGNAIFSDAAGANSFYICYVAEEGWGIFIFAAVDGLIKLLRAYGDVVPLAVLPKVVLDSEQGLTVDEFLAAFYQ